MPDDWLDALTLSLEYVGITIGLVIIVVGLVLALVDLFCSGMLVFLGLLTIFFAFIYFHPEANKSRRVRVSAPPRKMAASYYPPGTASLPSYAPLPMHPGRRCACGFNNPPMAEFCQSCSRRLP